MNKVNKYQDRYHVIAAILIISLMICVGTVSFSYLEGWSLITSFYFSVATLMTVGYGDLHPTSETSMLFTAMYILIGVGITLSAITVIASDRINSTASRMRDYADNRKNDKDDEFNSNK